jgi:enoyl-CoA hydratase/carnithine racemase
MSSNQILLRHDQDGIARLTLNRPQARNALSLGLIEALQGEIERIAQDARVKVVVIAANGPAFSAGHDLKEIRANPSREAYEELFERCSRLMVSITRLPKPVIAQIHAMATAAGCQLVATCDLALAARSARFATPGVNIGLFCSTPMVALSRAVGRKMAMEMLLSGEAIDAETAQRIGLINRAVADDELDPAVERLAQSIAAKSPATLAIGKEAFYRQIEMGLEEAYAYAGATMVRNMETQDAQEGIDAFIAKRQPTWKGC